ncbi:MAG: CopG family ribbon-helix-helix protein [Promethearchaeota archaeon]
MEEYKRFTVSLPQKLYDKFEEFRKQLNISRSDCIRKAMKAFMVREENLPISSGNVVGCITMITYHDHVKQIGSNDISNIEHIKSHQKTSKFFQDHSHNNEESHKHNYYHEHDYSSKPIYANVQQTDFLLSNDIQHHFGDVIISNMHIHIEFEKCMEIIAVSGSYERVKKLHDNLKKLKSVLSIDFFVVDKE